MWSRQPSSLRVVPPFLAADRDLGTGGREEQRRVEPEESGILHGMGD